jgi:hypothetical protein
MSRTPVARTLVAALVATACALALAACTKDHGAGGGGGGTGNTILGTAPQATMTSTPPSYPSTAEVYAKAAVAAWAARDIERLDQLEESGGTLHMLYGCNGCYDIHFVLVGCSGAAGSTYCRFFNNVGDGLLLRLSNPALGQPRAVAAGGAWDPITFPSDDKAYAQEALTAWPLGNDNRLKLLTANQMTSARISALGADRTAQWTYEGSSGAAGSTGYSWGDGAGHHLTFLFTNGPAAPTTGPNAQHRIKQIFFNTA